MTFSAIANGTLRVRRRRGGGMSSYFGGDAAAVESAVSDILAASGVTGRAGGLSAFEFGADVLRIAGVVASGGGPQVINVANVGQLIAAVDAANAAGGNRDIVLADLAGGYTLTTGLPLRGPFTTIRSASGNWLNCIVQGQSMSGGDSVGACFHVYASDVAFGDRVGSGGGFTIQRCGQSGIQIHGEDNAKRTWIRNMRIIDTYEHSIKVSINQANPVGSSDDGVVENCTLGYTASAAPFYYTGGVDAHGVKRWLVRGNTFRNFASPATREAEHACHVWDGAEDCVIEKNTFINCDRGVGYGLRGANDQSIPFRTCSGGIVRNNYFYHANNGAPYGDVAFDVQEITGTPPKVYNNTVLSLHSYANAGEIRFVGSSASVYNNLTNKPIALRDGAQFAGSGTNITNAAANWFVDPANGDFTLTAAGAAALDSGTTLADVTDDHNGTARPQGSAFDVGGYEKPFVPPITNPRLLPRLQAQHVSYLGSIIAPNLSQYEFGGACLALYPGGQSMYMGKQDETNNAFLGRFSVPNIGATATSIQTPVNVPGSVGPGVSELGGAIVYNNRLIVGKFRRYDADGSTTANLAAGSLTVSGFTSFSAVANQPTRNFSGQYLGHIPPEWQPLFGNKPCFTGSSTTSIISQCANGPSIFAINPNDIGVVSPIPSVPLLYYTYGNTDGSNAHPLVAGRPPPQNEIWAWADFPAAGMAMIDGTRTAIFITRHGYGPRTYKSTTADPCDPSGAGEQAYPYRYQATLWDMADLADVAAGIKQPWEPQPYATFALPGISDSCCLFVFGGIAWDSATRRLYVVPRYGGGTKRIQVYHLALPT